MLMFSTEEVLRQKKKSSALLHNYLNFPREGRGLVNFGNICRKSRYNLAKNEAGGWMGWQSQGLHYARDVGPKF